MQPKDQHIHQPIDELVKNQPPPLEEAGQQQQSPLAEFVVEQPQLEKLEEQQPQLE